MTTKEMMDLPLGTQVISMQTCEIYEKVAHDAKNDYRCSFRKVGARGLSSKVTKFHAKRVSLVPVILGRV